MNRFVIFSGGDIFDYSVVPADKSDTVVICADGGFYHAKKLGISPDVMIGDFDSYSGEPDCKCRIIKCKPEKDDTDTMMCVKYAIEHGADCIYIYGGLSGRLDHTIANIQTLKYCAERKVRAEINDGFNRALVQGEKSMCEYRKDDSKYFSVFSLTDKVFIRELSGVKYPLEKYYLTSGFPLGVSNEITSDRATLEVSGGYALIIFSKK